jgi:hypothetical protein
MSDHFVEAFVEKLVLLEQKTGAHVQYRAMPPLTGSLPDHLAIQKQAKEIAAFIGLTEFTFIIGVAKQKKKVGGHIDLSTQGREVFVEIDEDMMSFPSAVAATLCHETCHKWLQVNGLGSPIKSEDEILTDITTVFLGFGKIMLNGCTATNVRHETIPNGTRTVTETKFCGYLDRGQFAFVYRLVCAMRNIPPSEFMQGLNPEATRSVEACDDTLGHHYADRFHHPETTRESVATFQARMVAIQHEMADLDKHVTYARKSFIETADGVLKAGHRKLKSLRDQAVTMTQETEPDPVLRFLRTIQRDSRINHMTDDLRSVGQDSEALLQHAKAIGRHVFRNGNRFPHPIPSMFNVVTCPQDDTKLRLPESSGDLVATCPTCKYRFAYNTDPLSFPEPPLPRKLTWLERCRNLVKEKAGQLTKKRTRPFSPVGTPSR